MSADNYNLVRRVKRGNMWAWGVWLNLSASCERDEQTAARKVDRLFGDVKDAVRWAGEQGYTEYGTEVEEAGEDNNVSSLNRFVLRFHAPPDDQLLFPKHPRVTATCLSCGYMIMELRDGSIIDGELEHVSGQGRPNTSSAAILQHTIESHAAKWCTKDMNDRVIERHWKQVVRDAFIDGRDDEAIQLILEMTNSIAI